MSNNKFKSCKVCEWGCYIPNHPPKTIYKIRPTNDKVKFVDKQFDTREEAYQYAKELGFNRVYGRKSKFPIA